MMRGEEIMSGAQRCHDVKLLEVRKQRAPAVVDYGVHHFSKQRKNTFR